MRPHPVPMFPCAISSRIPRRAPARLNPLRQFPRRRKERRPECSLPGWIVPRRWGGYPTAPRVPLRCERPVRIVHGAVCGTAEADEIPGRPGIFRIVFRRPNMVHGDCLHLLAVAHGLPALVPIPAQHAGAQLPPSARMIILPHVSNLRVCAVSALGLSPPAADEKSRSQRHYASLRCHWLRLSKHWPLSISTMFSVLQSLQ